MQKNIERLYPYVPWAACILTGLLSAALFPPLGWSQAAWVALVPGLLAARVLPPPQAFLGGLLAGAVG